MSLTATVGGRQVKAGWVYVDGMAGLNSHVDSWLFGILDGAAAAAGGRYQPVMALNGSQSVRPATMVSAEPVLASGTVIVVREVVIDTGADGTRSGSSATIYADTVSGEMRRGAELLRPEALEGIRPRVTGVPAGIAGPPAQGPALTDVVLDSSGELRVTAERPAGGGHSRQEVTTIAAGDADAMLNEVGRKVLGRLRAAPVSPPAVAPALRHVNCDLVPCAALSYDDGPDARTTPQLLAILKQKNAQATFFMTGSNATANPATAKQIADAGHTIGNHTFSHPYLTKLTPAAVRSEMDRTDAAIRAATGSAPSLMRPPYGAADAAVQMTVGRPLILWAVDSLDWQSKNPAVFVPKILKEITPGAVVLMHDVDPTTIAGQQELITNLQAQGYRLVTVPQMFEGTPLVSGHVYRARPERK
jgi:peptidoglycan/xylan/chitin deacetylase (PgdA/CDA1 family)